jgi:hypothetical protein
MTGERWQRIKSLFERALDQPAAARDAFIDAAGESPSIVVPNKHCTFLHTKWGGRKLRTAVTTFVGIPAGCLCFQ